MFPSIKQRVILALGVVVAAIAGEAFRAAAFGAVNGRGATLLGTHEPAAALAAMLLWAAVVVALALICGSTGNPLSGAFVIGAGLLYVAGQGGSIDGWIRGIDSPNAYYLLAAEAVLWAVPIITATLVLRYLRGKVRAAASVLRSPCCEETEPVDEAPPRAEMGATLLPIVISAAAVYGLQPALFGGYIMTLMGVFAILLSLWATTMAAQSLLDRRSERSVTRAHVAPAYLGAAVMISVAGAGLIVLMRNADPGQIIGAMLVSFTAAALLAHQLFPSKARLTMLAGPLILGVAAYVWTAMDARSMEAMLASYYADYPRSTPPIQPILPLALALPVFYGSGGIAGVAMGVGWSQTIHASRHKHVVVVA